MADMGQFAQALQGFGAGLSGQGVQWQNAQTLSKEQQSREQELLRAQRIQAFYTDVAVARQMAAEGDFASANQLMRSRQENMAKMGGPLDGNSEHTDIMAGLSEIAANPSHPAAPEAQQRLIRTLDNYAAIGASLMGRGQRGYNSTASNQMFKDGSVLQANRDGTTTFRDPSGQLLEGEARMAALNNAIASGVWLAGQEAGARANAANSSELTYAGPTAVATAQGTQTAQAGIPGVVPSAAENAAAAERAKAEAAADVERNTQAKLNETAFNMYREAFDNYNTMIGVPTSGPVMGNAPAFTVDQQKYDAAKGMLFPLIKAAFKVKGDQLSDTDSKALEALISGRNIDSKVAASQAQTLDKIMREKFGVGKGFNAGGQPSTQTGSTRKVVRRGKDQATGRPVVMYDDGTIEAQ